MTQVQKRLFYHQLWHNDKNNNVSLTVTFSGGGTALKTSKLPKYK